MFSIERQRYFTSEADASVEVCVVHDSGELEEPVELTLCTSNGNAISNDYYSCMCSALPSVVKGWGPYPFITDLALMWDRGGVKIFDVGTIAPPKYSFPIHLLV